MIRTFLILLLASGWAVAIIFSLSDPNVDGADIIFIILTLVLATWLCNPDDRNQS